MDALRREYELSLYHDLTHINSSDKSEVLIVQHTLSGRLYIKKILKSYNIEVYEKLKQIDSPHLPKIQDLFEVDDKLIIIEDYINGRSFEALLSEHGTLKEDEVIAYMMTLCDVLTLLHEQEPPIIHRDIKPSNIMISDDGVLKLIDFDVSRLYRHDRELDTHILGTKGYAAPEQFGFEQTDARTDIYAIGVLMNVLTTGQNPKIKKNETKLYNIIHTCIQLSPNERFQNVKNLKAALWEYQQQKQAKTTTTDVTFEQPNNTEHSKPITPYRSELLEKVRYNQMNKSNVQSKLKENKQSIDVLQAVNINSNIIKEQAIIEDTSLNEALDAELNKQDLNDDGVELTQQDMNSKNESKVWLNVKEEDAIQNEPLNTNHNTEKMKSTKVIPLIKGIVKDLPGYRGKNIIFASLATFWYVFLLFGATTVSPIKNVFLFVENILFVVFLVCLTLLNGNYKNIFERIPLLNNHLIVGLIVFNFLLFMIWGLVSDFLLMF